MTDFDNSHVPRAVATVTEVLALEKLVERGIRACDDRLEQLAERAHEFTTLADEAVRRELTAHIESVRREILLIQEAHHRAVEKAESSQDERNKQQNEWRATVTDLIARTTTPTQLDQLRAAMTAQLESCEKRTDKLEEWKNVEQGQKQVRQVLLPVMVGVIVFILTQIARVMFPIVPTPEPQHYIVAPATPSDR